MLPLLFAPDAQPDDWYLWLLVGTGHAALVGFGLWAALPKRWAVPLAGAIYASWELAQLFLGGDPVDGLTDWAFVVCGAALAEAAWNGDRVRVAWLCAAFAIPAAIGVGIRL